MREILFRGKWKNTGEWVEGFPVQTVEGNFYIANIAEELGCGICIQETECYGNYEVIPETVSQYTGLTDKNGKKIFEGDVVKFTDSPFGYSYTGVVCFNGGSFCIKYEYWEKENFHRIGQTDKWQDMGASGIVTYQYEILGNIHDNPQK